MSVAQLYASMDSRELTQWHVFLVADAERQEDARRRAREDRAILGSET